jgi:hypothetical protein
MTESTAPGSAHSLSDDGMTLVIRQQVHGGVRTATYHRDPQAGPFTDADVTLALGLTPAAGRRMEPGQRNRSRRMVTRFGTAWTHVMTGPPTWWLPKLRREQDGTVMAGWLRLAVAVRWEKPGRPVAGTATPASSAGARSTGP